MKKNVNITIERAQNFIDVMKSNAAKLDKLLSTDVSDGLEGEELEQAYGWLVEDCESILKEMQSAIKQTATALSA